MSRTVGLVGGTRRLSLIAVTLLAALVSVHFHLAARRADAAREKFLTAESGVCRQAATVLLKIETAYFRDVKGLNADEAAKSAKAVVESIPQDENYLVAVEEQLDRRHRELSIEWGPVKEPPPIESALRVWVEIYTALNGIDRPSLGWFRIAKLDVTQAHAALTIEIGSDAVIDRIANALGNNEYLRERAKNPKFPTSTGAFAKNAATGRFSGTVRIEFRGYGS